jgi:AcrR family transcriptional regulator
LPANARISRDDIINAAFKIVRKGGWAQLSARSIATMLKSSTMPIYSQFKTMEMIEKEVFKKIVDLQSKYLREQYTDVPALNNGIGYVLFAWKEQHLFAAINDEKHIPLRIQYRDELFDAHVDDLTRNPRMADISREQLSYFQFLGWAFVQGIATLKPWIAATQGKFDKEKLIELIRDGSKTLTYGFIEMQARSNKKNKKVKAIEKK